jgi:hypothetical protein
VAEDAAARDRGVRAFQFEEEKVARLKDLELPSFRKDAEIDLIGVDPGEIVEPGPVGDAHENLDRLRIMAGQTTMATGYAFAH